MSNQTVSIQSQLTTCKFDTPLGSLSALANKDTLLALSFSKNHLKCIDDTMCVKVGENAVIRSLKKELKAYFSGKLTTFTTPFYLQGTPFQQSVWKALCQIPFGETRSYADISKCIRKPTAFRAVANANGANPLVILVPCHRVIYANGSLGGYSAGLKRKTWLLSHENITL